MSTRPTRGSAPLLHFKLSRRSGESPCTRLKKTAGENHRRNLFQTPKPLDCTVISKHSGNKNPPPWELVARASGNLTHRHGTNLVRKNITEIRRWNGCESAPILFERRILKANHQHGQACRTIQRLRPSWEAVFRVSPVTMDDKSIQGIYPDLRQTKSNNC